MTIITLVCLIFHLILFIVGVINPTIGFMSPIEIEAPILKEVLLNPINLIWTVTPRITKLIFIANIHYLPYRRRQCVS